MSIPVNDQLLLPFLREGHARTHRSRLATEALLIWGMVSDAALSSRSALGTCAVSPLLANWSAPVPLAEACLLALWITILSAAVPKKERVPHEGRLEGTRRETTQNQYTFSEGGGLGGRGEQNKQKCPNNLMAKLEESIYSYPGTSNKKCFLDAQTFITLISLS